MSNDLYGWFDSAEQREPTYDPPHNAPCPYCGSPCSDDDVRTHSLMAAENAKRAFYYRTHITCDEAATDGEKQSIFDAVIERIEHDGNMA